MTLGAQALEVALIVLATEMQRHDVIELHGRSSASGRLAPSAQRMLLEPPAPSFLQCPAAQPRDEG